MFRSFADRVDAIINEAERSKSVSQDAKAAVAVVQYKNKWLLGLSLADDDRRNRWCCPGGGVKRGESITAAAERECREETGVKVKAAGRPFTMSDRPHVYFVHCKVVGTPKPKPNHEFSNLDFFAERDMQALKLFKNVKELIRKCT